ncbi:MAG: hypothetical protein ACRDNT_04590 [Streptosporangiaceae bacterium]
MRDCRSRRPTVRSHAVAHAATEVGHSEREIMKIEVDHGTVTTDQGIRPQTSTKVLAKLQPAFDAHGRTTAATSSQVSDGASAVLLMSHDKADELGIRSRARVVDQAVVGVDPRIMLTGPIPATHKILDRNGRNPGAKRGAISNSYAATPSHCQQASTQLDATSGDIKRFQATAWRCLLSSGWRVRILPDALI